MKFTARRHQYSYGFTIGVLQFGDCLCASIPGAVGNATTYDFPILYKPVDGLSFQSLRRKDMAMREPIIEAGRWLQMSGVQAIVANCGFFALWQEELAEALEVPCYLSSLLQIPFLVRGLRNNEKVGILTANSDSLDSDFLHRVGITDDMPIAIRGLQDKPYFKYHVLDENPEIDSNEICKEVVAAAREMVERDTAVRIIMMECSELPPYASEVQKAVALPVYDFVTMINFIHSGLARSFFHGYM